MTTTDTIVRKAAAAHYAKRWEGCVPSRMGAACLFDDLSPQAQEREMAAMRAALESVAAHHPITE